MVKQISRRQCLFFRFDTFICMCTCNCVCFTALRFMFGLTTKNIIDWLLTCAKVLTQISLTPCTADAEAHLFLIYTVAILSSH